MVFRGIRQPLPMRRHLARLPAVLIAFLAGASLSLMAVLHPGVNVSRIFTVPHTVPESLTDDGVRGRQRLSLSASAIVGGGMFHQSANGSFLSFRAVLPEPVGPALVEIRRAGPASSDSLYISITPIPRPETRLVRAILPSGPPPAPFRQFSVPRKDDPPSCTEQPAEILALSLHEICAIP